MSIDALTHSYNKNNAIYAFLTRVTSSFIYAFISKSEVATKATQEHLRVCLKQTRTCTHSRTHTHSYNNAIYAFLTHVCAYIGKSEVQQATQEYQRVRVTKLSAFMGFVCAHPSLCARPVYANNAADDALPRHRFSLQPFGPKGSPSRTPKPA